MGCILKNAQETTTQINGIDLHVMRGMRKHQRSDKRTQECTLARLRRTHNREVTTCTGKIQNIWYLRLFLRHIQQAQWNTQCPKRRRLWEVAPVQRLLFSFLQNGHEWQLLR